MKIKELDKIETNLNKNFREINPKIKFAVEYNENIDEIIILAFWNQKLGSISCEKSISFRSNSLKFQNCLENEIKPFFLDADSDFYK
jgi:hypothetical protein